MVISVDIKHIFKYPVQLVSDTHLTKYPNDKDRFVEKVVTLEHSVDRVNGLDYRRRWAFCQNVIPSIFRKMTFLNEDHLVLEEEAWLNITSGQLHLKSRNITWSKYAVMWEESKFSPADENPHWTKFEQHGRIEIPKLGILGSVLETFANKFLQHGVKKLRTDILTSSGPRENVDISILSIYQSLGKGNIENARSQETVNVMEELLQEKYSKKT